MNLNDLTKEQKQYIVLGVLAISILLVLGGVAIKNSLASITAAKTELEQLSLNLENAKNTLMRQKRMNQEYEPSKQQILKYLTKELPKRNRYIEADNIICSIAKENQLRATTKPTPLQQENASPSTSAMECYALRIDAQGSYDSVRSFVQAIHSEFPLARISKIDISAGRSETEHKVLIQIQWLCSIDSITKDWNDLDSAENTTDLPPETRLVDQKMETEPENNAPKNAKIRSNA